MSDRVDRLITAAAACLTCGEVHKFRECECGCNPDKRPRHPGTWASTVDGHTYRRRAISVDWLYEWAANNP